MSRASSEIDATRIRIEGRAAAIVESTAAVARELDMAMQVKWLEAMRASLRTSAEEEPREEIFKIVVCGRFRNGKSTFLNALLGRTLSRVALPPGAKGPMPMEYGIPTTATLTHVRYSDTPFVRAWRFDGSSEDWSFERYCSEARLWVGETDNSRLFEDIKLFEVGYPAELLKSGVTVIDSPGVDEDPRRTATTREAIADAAASIIVYKSDALAGEAEQAFSAEVRALSGQTFTIINRFHGVPLSAPFRAMAAQRLGLDPKRFVDNPAQFDVYAVDALTALDASVEADPVRLETSGMTGFEQRLSRFLLEERYPAYVEHVVKGIDLVAARVEENVAQHRAVLGAAQRDLDAVIADCREQIAEIERRSAKIKAIIERGTRHAERSANDSYTNLVIDMEAEVPAEFAATALPLLQGLGSKLEAMILDEKYVKDAFGVLNGIVARRLQAWAETQPPAKGLLADIGPDLEDMRRELAIEIEAIDRALAAMQLRIRTLDPEFQADGTPVVSLTERLMWAGLGLLLQNYGMVIAGGAGGWRGAVGGLVGGVTAAVVASVIAVAFGSALAAPALILIAMGGWVLGGTAVAANRIERLVRERALEAFMPQLRKLRTDPDARSLMVAHVRTGLEKLSADIGAVVDTAIGEERGKLEQFQRTKTLDRNEKEALLSRLAAGGVQLKRNREQLRELAAEIRRGL